MLKEAIDFIYSFYNETLPLIKFDLHDREFRNPRYIRELIAEFGVKVDRGKNILVVGSKGKGTTATILAEILRTQGYKVGLFTSPHLERFTERIKINGQEIEENLLIQYIKKLQPFAQKKAAQIPKPYYLGPNGLFLTIALKYFEEMDTDFNILESGRGGQYDDIYQMGDHVIFTPIVLEHKYRLGPTLDDVVRTKGLVVDQKTKTVVISKQSLEVIKGLQNCFSEKVKVYQYDRDFKLERHLLQKGSSNFLIKIKGDSYTVRLSTLAEYIGINLSAALMMAKTLLPTFNKEKLPLLESAVFNGRCEIMNTDPLILLDGMICRESAEYVVNTLKKLHLSGEKVAIAAIPKDKDYQGVMEVLSKEFFKIILTKSIGAQYPFFQDFVPIEGLKVNCLVYTSENLDDALNLVAKSSPKIIGIFGTQSLIGEARKKFQKIFDNNK
ncbi:dihydrofolate synthase / folylpolyglutamate synthase [Anaerobranca californiensis DSM 14826]|jgi:dihydrofolate synthase/folylpolyglutamate synthase|uniref:Dihydrofolate synthase / folylpolyglutamate synthase n=1 Tax=Anaerobranca californiensis DSM 14826 TaxID=1120989 RepID=A0A1M6NZN5_9FIRM|nr:Mur ligase family protein [Anaerobranca californiensis]SHK01131.1 dihydrofolate synthase / folylpolyglutamate synthase [Anaerobranca californiensis DSM 14826]